MGKIIILKIVLFWIHLSSGSTKHKDGTHTEPSKKYDKHGSQTGGTKREIRIGFKVCGKTDISNVISSKKAKVLGKSDINDILQIKNGPSKRSWGKEWMEKLDQCCNTHDSCPRVVAPRETKYGYKNAMDYKVYDCDCDDQFASCLKQANSFAADAVGDLYFNVLHIPCVRYGSKVANFHLDHTDIIIQNVKGHETGKLVPEVKSPDAVIHVFHEHNGKPTEDNIRYENSKVDCGNKEVVENCNPSSIEIKIADKKSPLTDKLSVKQPTEIGLVQKESESSHHAYNINNIDDDKLTAAGKKILIGSTPVVLTSKTPDEKVSVPQEKERMVNPSSKTQKIDVKTVGSANENAEDIQLNSKHENSHSIVEESQTKRVELTNRVSESSPVDIVDNKGMKISPTFKDREFPIKREAKHYTKSASQ